MKKLAFLTGTIVLFILFYSISGSLLTFNKSVDSPYALLEGWISHYHMEFAANYIITNNYDSVFIVGMIDHDTTLNIQQAKESKKAKEFDSNYVLYTNGILGFEIPTKRLQDFSKLNITMRGTKALKHFPHFQVFINKQLIGSGFVNEMDSIYKFSLFNNTTDSISYVLINFDNHIMPSEGDRHLVISDITMDNVNIDSISIENIFIDNSPIMYFELISGLNRIKYYLADRGYDTTKVKLIELEPKPFNKSIAIAKGTKEYFKKTKIKKINIITNIEHSRRSYINYKNAVKDIEFGCIILPYSSVYENSLYLKIDERLSLFLTWIYWWFQ